MKLAKKKFFSFWGETLLHFSPKLERFGNAEGLSELYSPIQARE
jgi:hypothetical protein